MTDVRLPMLRPIRIPGLWLDALALYGSLLAGLSLLALLVWIQADSVAPCHLELGMPTAPRTNSDGVARLFIGVWERWDACWYERIAEHGYTFAPESVAFFPALPLAMRVVGSLMGGNYALAGMVLSAASMVLTIAMLERLVRIDHDAATASRSSLYLVAFPASFYLIAPFSEALFLASTVATVLAARLGHWGLVPVAALAASLTRPQGILLIVPLLMEAVRQHADPARRPALSRLVVACATPVAGFVAFALYAWLLVGQTPMDAQRHWGAGRWDAPWVIFGSAWEVVWSRGDHMHTLNLAVMVGSVGITVWAARHLPASMTAYAAVHLGLLFFRPMPTPFMSSVRFVLVVFPIFVALAVLGKNERVHRAWLIASLVLLGWLAASFIRGEFVA